MVSEGARCLDIGWNMDANTSDLASKSGGPIQQRNERYDMLVDTIFIASGPVFSLGATHWFMYLTPVRS